MRLKDIAAIANVSEAAVSLALAGKPGISEETRERIVRIAHESGYVSKHMIQRYRSLPDAKSLQLIACADPVFLQDQMENVPFFNELIYYIEETSRALDCRLLFTTVSSDKFMDSFNRLQNDGIASGHIIIGSYLSFEQLLKFSQLQPKAVVLDSHHPTIPLNMVSANHRMGGYQAGEYLLRIGHTRIGIVQSKPRNYNFEERREGFNQALQSHGRTVDKTNAFWVMPGEVNAQEDFKKQIRDHRGPLPTALFCENDYIAISVMKSFHELGIKVPDDISIIGYDDLREATVVTPELTTIRVGKKQMAEASVRLIQQIIAGDQTLSSKILVDTTVIERQSCKPLK